MVGTVGKRRRRGRLGEFVARFIAAILLLVGLTAGASARADEPLPLTYGRLSDAEWAFLQAFIVERYAGGDANGFADMFRNWRGLATRREAWSYIRNERLATGHYDLDGDGTEELLVHTWLGCGNIGCPTYVFSREAEGLRQVENIIASSEEDHCIVKLGPDDPPILRTYAAGHWWTGTGYDWVCLYDCSPEESAHHPEMRAVLAERDCTESK